MLYRVLKPFPMDTEGVQTNRRQRDEQKKQGRTHFKQGELIDVLTKPAAAMLTSMSLIGDSHHTHFDSEAGTAAPEFWAGIRIGFFLHTSPWYSGGRVHLYQYALSLALAGADVYLITNTIPLWARDYPATRRLHVWIKGRDRVPPDLDIIVTDGKGLPGQDAIEYHRKHPSIPFLAMNFETPNWVVKYSPEYAKQLSMNKEPFLRASALLANSRLSAEHLLAWIGKEGSPCYVIRPKVNDWSLETSRQEIPKSIPPRPYAVCSARTARYKNLILIQQAIWALDIPFDLVCFGTIERPMNDNILHKAHWLRRATDMEKYGLMRSAHMVLAPSLFEGFGLVPMEAISSGTPCIVYDLPVIREEYGATKGIVYIPWNKPKEFAAAVKRLAHEPKMEVDSERIQKEHSFYGAIDEARKVPHLRSIGKRSVSAYMIAYWGVVPEALEAVYPYVDEIIIAYGPDRNAIELIGPDGSLEVIRNFPDPEKKITIEERPVWRDKQEMRSWCLSRVRGNLVITLDGDEIWTGLDQWLAAEINWGCPRWVNFWHSGKHWIHDPEKWNDRRWGTRLDPFGSWCHHYRWSWWRPSYRMTKHTRVEDVGKHEIFSRQRNEETARKVPGAVIYHLGHALPRETMKAKHEYYRARDGDDAVRQKRERIWHEWSGKLGDIGDGIVEAVDWELPEIVRRALERIK